ncbi:hypothetical protein J8281_14700 [Aquimarina sp. U1-2]|uniref:hypothetical protein n=1 Tax=Aquimarina sp. U1-2 TaxID=2823141 RepID=UPI001AECFE66|nr:hypothetical protein [Aquimarina sp. U1-2]MBP2833442.1 hypothetical protein [Aquimarina sp. U1-2]
MDELELLKQDWKKQEAVLPRLSYEEIYQMILKKSSSIVKWIFIISILEFIVWASLDLIFRLTGLNSKIMNSSIEIFSFIGSLLSYTILLYFIIRFYINYKKIKTTDSTKVLMENILNTRKTVKNYIWVNLSFFGVLMISTTIYLLFFTNEFQGDTIEYTPIWIVIVSTLLVTIVFIGVIALFYRLIYGILTRKLKKNYKELERLEL